MWTRLTAHFCQQAAVTTAKCVIWLKWSQGCEVWVTHEMTFMSWSVKTDRVTGWEVPRRLKVLTSSYDRWKTVALFVLSISMKRKYLCSSRLTRSSLIKLKNMFHNQTGTYFQMLRTSFCSNPWPLSVCIWSSSIISPPPTSSAPSFPQPDLTWRGNRSWCHRMKECCRNPGRKGEQERKTGVGAGGV